eukprot:CAMPEP_0203920716 /NCGR_PEP_ID=MMETSP0359-20131031/60979_1 /ASSEMBLY_ACC=CAM_ASM_000338 /TAXON_ID=268821 /ORGANISM="Scrippsiella Hangoei, Strain SHTV-5" /LENGTH=81 /DNA_ID=CAMNT_0050848271 /DNA_START=46 /DNA_END=288 /DNA_ORIENTATION=-
MVHMFNNKLHYAATTKTASLTYVGHRTCIAASRSHCASTISQALRKQRFIHFGLINKIAVDGSKVMTVLGPKRTLREFLWL